jgi:hypothetical protein
VADRLETLAAGLSALTRGLSGSPSAKPAEELARSIAYWMIALRRLAKSGTAAWGALDLAFPRATDDGPPPEVSPDRAEPAELASELDVVSAFITGDMVLDDLAYAELVRRGQAPTWRPGVDQLPSMWPRFIRLIDQDLADPMSKTARYLDITLAVARDVLVAHRDPTWWYMPSFANWGEVTLARVAVEEERRAAGLRELQTVNSSLPFPWPETDYHHLLDLLIAIADHLDGAARGGIKKAYRAAGFESPSLADMVRAAIRLIELHAGELEKLVEQDRGSAGSTAEEAGIDPDAR